jgi:hypothetical protein
MSYDGPERRLMTEHRITALEVEMDNQLKAGADRMDKIETDLKTNNEATTRIEANTTEMLEFFNSVRGAFRVLDMLGKLAKPLAYILMVLGSLVGLWFTFKNGIAPPKP